MDDPKTRQTLDALAELFLTGPLTPAGASAERGTAVPTPPLDGRSSLLEQLEAPSPIRLPPKPAAGAIRSAAHGNGGNGSLPRRFTQTEIPSPKSDIQPHTRPSLQVEVVLLGSLPGFNGPWLTQYARYLAQQQGPVVVVHLGDDRIDLEMVHPAAGQPQSAQPRRMAEPDAAKAVEHADSPVEAIEYLLSARGHAAGAVLVHPLEPASALAVDLVQRLGRGTLLCGAYDSAVVDAFRIVKQVAESRDGYAPTGDSRDGPPASRRPLHLGLMVMGSDEDRARAAIRKLNSAAALLRTPIELVGWQKQMVPVNLRELGSFPGGLAPRMDLLAYLEELSAQPAGPGAPAQQPATFEDALALAQAAARKPQPDAAATHAPADEIRPARPERSKLPDRPESLEPMSADTFGQEPSNVEAQAPAWDAQHADEQPRPPAATDDAPNLSAFLIGALAGGIVLQASCPRQPQTQLVLDQEGRLHLLRRAQADVRAAIVDLLEARRWTLEHLALIALTQRQCRFDPAAEPTLHLFTDQGALAAALATRLGEQIRVHLLQQVAVGSRTAWVSTPLN